MIRIKICGITRQEDGLAAAEAGADALGFVFFPGSKRYIMAEQAATIIDALPPLVTIVGLFVNATREEIRQTARQCRLDRIQLHGDEPPDACLNQPCRVIRALRVGEAADLDAMALHPVDAFLLDAKVGGAYGGTGTSFDWGVLRNRFFSKPVILAGGLDPDNVAQAVEQVRPYAVDVSSGVESAPGIKDHEKMRLFVLRARAASDAASPTQDFLGMKTP